MSSFSSTDFSNSPGKRSVYKAASIRRIKLRLSVSDCVDDETKVELSQSTSIAGEAAFLALEAAVTDLKRGAVDVLLTAPINKHNIQNDEFHFPGHTEYLEERFGGVGRKALMILMKDGLFVVHLRAEKSVCRIRSKRHDTSFFRLFHGRNNDRFLFFSQ